MSTGVRPSASSASERAADDDPLRAERAELVLPAGQAVARRRVRSRSRCAGSRARASVAVGAALLRPRRQQAREQRRARAVRVLVERHVEVRARASISASSGSISARRRATSGARGGAARPSGARRRSSRRPPRARRAPSLRTCGTSGAPNAAASSATATSSSVSRVRAGDVDEPEREHPRARLEGEPHLAAHRVELLGGRLRVAAAEDESRTAPWPIDGTSDSRRPRRVERVEVLGERRPRPLGRALALERAQVRAPRLAAVGRDRRGREPVGADHLGREALQQLRREQRVVQRRERRVRVQVDEAGAEHRAGARRRPPPPSTAPRSPTAAIARPRPPTSATSGGPSPREDRRRRGRRGQTTADMPPSTYRIWPLTKSDAADARKTTAPAELGRLAPAARRHARRSHASNPASALQRAGQLGAEVAGPDRVRLDVVRAPSRRTSPASASSARPSSPRTPPIVARASLAHDRADVDDLPARARSIICGATARATRNALVRLTSSSSRHSASENCSSGLRSVMPALLTSTSTGPSRATPAATASSSVTSNGAATAPAISAARASHASAGAAVDRDARARVRERPREREPEPARRAGDERRPPRQVEQAHRRDDGQHDVRRVRRRVQHGLARDLHPRAGADVLAGVQVAREAREARARHVEPHAVAPLEAVRHRVAADAVLGDLARLEQLGRVALVRVAVARADDPLGDEDRLAVGVDVAEAHDEVGVARATTRRTAPPRPGRSRRGRGRACRSCRRARRRGASSTRWSIGPGRTGVCAPCVIVSTELTPPIVGTGSAGS